MLLLVFTQKTSLLFNTFFLQKIFFAIWISIAPTVMCYTKNTYLIEIWAIVSYDKKQIEIRRKC